MASPMFIVINGQKSNNVNEITVISLSFDDDAITRSRICSNFLRKMLCSSADLLGESRTQISKPSSISIFSRIITV